MSVTPTLYNVLSFSGNGTYVEVADPFEDPTTFTISAWVKPAVINDGKYHAFIGKQEGDAYHRKPGMWLSPSGKALHCDSRTPDLQGRYTTIINDILEKDQWVHVAWVKRGTKYEVYKNGELASTFDAPEAVHTSQTSYWIGKVDNHWIGQIAEVRIWKVARSQAEIAGDMRRRLTGTEPGLSRYWAFDEGTGGTVQDRTRKAEGTIYQATWVKSDLPLLEPEARPSVAVRSVNTTGDEYVELVVLYATYNLSGHRLHVVGTNKDFIFPEGTVITPGTPLRVYTNKAGDLSFGAATPLWNTHGDAAQLYSQAGILLSEYATLPASVAVKSVNTTGDEYVELVVLYKAYNLSGHRLHVGGTNKDFIFPEGTVITPGSPLRVYTNKDGGLSFGSATAIWGATGDVARLYTSAGVLLSEHSYGTPGSAT